MNANTNHTRVWRRCARTASKSASKTQYADCRPRAIAISAYQRLLAVLFLRCSQVASIVVCVLFVGVTSLAAAPPNVLMIVSDDQAWTDYGFMGHPRIRTPHLDRLASESAVFTRGYVP